MAKLLIRLDDRMVDLDKPVTVTHGGKELFDGHAAADDRRRWSKTLAGRGDPRLMFDAEVAVDLPGAK